MNDLTLPHRITSYECGADKLMKPECFQHFCQEMAEEHASAHGFGYDWVMSNRTAWVQVQGHYEIVRRPAWKETVYLRTNTGKASSLQAGRFVEMTDQEGNVLARADLQWVIIHFDTRRPVPPRRVGLPLDKPCPVLGTPLQEPTWPENSAMSVDICSSRRDVDFNGHINNSAYLIWALDTLPPELKPGTEVLRYRINFRGESHAGETMRISHYVQGCYTRHVITCGDEIRAEIAIEWQ